MWISTIKEFIETKSINISQKLSIAIIVLGFIIVGNNLLGLSYNYRINNKVSQIEQLSELIANPNLDSVGRNYAITLRDEIYNRKPFTEDFYNYFTSSVEKRKIVENIERKNNYRFSSDVFYHLSSAGIYYILGLILIPVGLAGFTNMNIVKRLAVCILLFLVFFFVGFVMYFICSLIPIISQKTLAYNYIINAALQLSSFYLLGRESKKKKATPDIPNHG